MFITIPSGWQWLVIVIVVLLLFGARRLPGVASDLGASIRRFREAYHGKPEREDDPPR